MAEEPQQRVRLLEVDEEEFEEELNHYVAVELLREAERVVKRLVESLDSLRDVVKDVISRVKIERLSAAGEQFSGVAVDSTFPPEGGIELVGGLLVGVVAGYIVFGGLQFTPPRGLKVSLHLALSDEERRLVAVRAKFLEKRLALKVLEEARRSGIHVPLLLVDGEIVPYQILFRRRLGLRLLRRLDEATVKLLEAAHDLGTTVVGVVKRSYSQLLSTILGKRLPLNDKAIASLLLGPGEYMVLGTYGELLPAYEKLGGRIAEAGRAAAARIKERKVYGEIVAAFYKPLNPPSQAVKVEILDYGRLGVHRVLSALASLTNPATGLPYPIDLVDEYVRLEARSLELARRRIVSRLVEELGPSVAVVLAHTNPEKRYLYEPRRFRGR